MELRDPAVLERALRRDPELHVYELGDLDPFFFPRTRWLALDPAGPIALLYDGAVLLLLARAAELDAAGDLLAQLGDVLPPRLHAHLSPGLGARLPAGFRAGPPRRLVKMALRGELPAVDEAGVEPLGAADEAELLAFYARAYPDNWFDPRMLATGCYAGVRAGGELACAGGVHVLSERTRVAALGNIATDPRFRGRGLARRVTARICRAVRPRVELVALNVRADNEAALRCYRGLGFAPVAEYEEMEVGASAGKV
jgi:ribosomal protein S18 acetylase RimI-like enzyme